MAVDKDLLQLDLYGLLGVSEKASEKEVSAVGRLGARPPPSLSRPGRPRPCSAAPRLALGGREGGSGLGQGQGLLSSSPHGCSKCPLGTRLLPEASPIQLVPFASFMYSQKQSSSGVCQESSC